MALKRRAQYIQENRALDLIGRHCDVFNQGKFLMNEIEIRIKLRTFEKFILTYGENGIKNTHSQCQFTRKKSKNKSGMLFAR